MKKTVDKRMQPRLELKGYIGDVADGHLVYDGIVGDISVEGLRLTDLPDRFIVDKYKKYKLVISGGTDQMYYKLTVSPRWKRQNGYHLEVGFNIIQASPNWKKFVRQRLPKKKKSGEEDIWDQYSGSSIG